MQQAPSAIDYIGWLMLCGMVICGVMTMLGGRDSDIELCIVGAVAVLAAIGVRIVILLGGISRKMDEL